MKNSSKKIVLIGAGNVATQLGMAFKKAKYTILEVYSPTKKSAQKLSSLLKTDYSTDLRKINTNADIYIISVKDDTIENVVKKLQLKNKIIIHTSGSTPMSILKNTSTNYGVFYPLQTFSKIKKIDFKNIPICLEANNNTTLKILQQLAKSTSNHITKVNSEQRKAIHLAAVFACNFTNHLYVIANDILSKKNLPFDILIPLIEETANKVKNYKPSKVQTGPAIRGEKKIIKLHLNALKENKNYLTIYKMLSDSIIASGKKNE